MRPALLSTLLLLVGCGRHPVVPVRVAPDGGVPSLIEAFGADCGGRALPTGGTGGGDLKRVVLHDPAALCNDGSPAVMFVHAAPAGPEQNHWVVYLQGGGQCTGADDCMARWCNPGSSDNKANMSSQGTPAGLSGVGILAESATNPLSGWNQVMLPYCSSDLWLGTNANAVELAEDGGAPYRLQFLGRRILETALAQLRQGVSSDDGTQQLPPLDSADRVVLAGTSAGSVGAQQNADWIRSQLPSQVEFSAVFDAVIGPTTLPLADGGTGSNALLFGPLSDWAYSDAGWQPIPDSSCAEAHPDPASRWECLDYGHVLANHVTTPFLARSDLDDPVLLNLVPGVPAARFAPIERQTLLALRNIPSTGEEGAQVTATPAVYGSLCGTHTVLVYPELTDESVRDANGTSWTFGQAMDTWIADGGFTEAVDDPASPTSMCP